MRTISVQQIPNGSELELPTLSYWFKAGIGFTLGAACVVVALWIASITLSLSLLSAWLRGSIR
jgi:hypothetical protein